MTDEKKISIASPSTLPPRKALPPFESLRAFDAVARLGGVRKAALYLCRDHAVVSRHLRAIENWTDTALIERTPAGIVLTEDGARYHRQIASALDTIAIATTDLMKLGEDSRVHVWCMPAFALHWLVSRLDPFEKANPKVEIELRPTDTRPDFNRQEADVDIRLLMIYEDEALQAGNAKSVALVSPATIPVASPDYLANAAQIKQPKDLLSHPLLHEENFDSWHAWLRAHGLKEEFELSGTRLWHGHLTLDAARRGRGIALTNPMVAADDLESGHLVEIGRDVTGFERIALGTYMFTARADRWNSPAIRRLRDWLVEDMASEPSATLGSNT